MAQTIVGLENVQPYKFSECSKTDYIDALRIGHGLCLLNKPNEVRIDWAFIFNPKKKCQMKNDPIKSLPMSYRAKAIFNFYKDFLETRYTSVFLKKEQNYCYKGSWLVTRKRESVSSLSLLIFQFHIRLHRVVSYFVKGNDKKKFLRYSLCTMKLRWCYILFLFFWHWGHIFN